jgi:hypothetical protein
MNIKYINSTEKFSAVKIKSNNRILRAEKNLKGFLRRYERCMFRPGNTLTSLGPDHFSTITDECVLPDGEQNML